MSCIDSAENTDSLAVTNAVSNLIAAMATRLQLELQNRRSSNDVERKLIINEEKSSSTLIGEEILTLTAPTNSLAENAWQIVS